MFKNKNIILIQGSSNDNIYIFAIVFHINV